MLVNYRLFDYIGKNNYFLINKYIKSSFYNYKIFRINDSENKIENIIVIRIIHTKKSKMYKSCRSLRKL